jgi:hypothetical protein
MYELEQKSSLRTQEIAFSSSWISKFQRGRIPPDPPTNATSWASVSLRAGSAPKWQAEVSDPEIPFSVIGLSFTRIYFDSRFQSANFAAFQISFTLGEKLSPHRWVLLSLPHTRETCWANRLAWQLAQQLFSRVRIVSFVTIWFRDDLSRGLEENIYRVWYFSPREEKIHHLRMLRAWCWAAWIHISQWETMWFCVT